MSVIRMLCGGLGNGKSAIANQEAFEHLMRGGVVGMNYPLVPAWHLKLARRVLGKHATKDEIFELAIDLWERCYRFGSVDSCYAFAEKVRTQTKGKAKKTREEWGLMLFDECKLYFNARDYNKKSEKNSNMEYITFFLNLRKFRINGIFMTHSDEDIDKQIRTTADTVTWCRNKKRRKLKGFSLAFSSKLPVFQTATIVSAKGAFKGDEEEKRDYPLDTDTCDLYDTFELFDNDGKHFELSRQGKNPIEIYKKYRDLKAYGNIRKANSYEYYNYYRRIPKALAVSPVL